MTGIHRKPSVVPGTGAHPDARWRYPADPSALRDAWRAETAPSWSRPRDWWAPEVDALSQAMCAPPAGLLDALPACARLGQARAESGVGLTEALDDLCALYRVLPAGSPPLPAVRAFVEAWADVWLRELVAPDCVDPLTELTSRSYLRTRLGELYRAVGDEATGRHALLVVALDAGEPGSGRGGGPAIGSAGGWRMLVRRLAVAEALRAAFPGGETLTGLTPWRTVALVERAEPTLTAVSTLRDQLAHRLGTGAARLWLRRLPDRAAELPDLLAELAAE